MAQNKQRCVKQMYVTLKGYFNELLELFHNESVETGEKNISHKLYIFFLYHLQYTVCFSLQSLYKPFHILLNLLQ